MNFGPRPGGREVTVGELATLGVEALGAQPWRHEPDPDVASRPGRWPSTPAWPGARWASRAGSTRPAAVALTMDWYRRQANGEDALALCRDQIAGYEGAA